MKPTDTLTCQVTPGSVEPTSLSCSMPLLESLELWSVINSFLTSIGAWATVGATLLLAYFAWKAWNTSQLTLKTMERQLEDQKRYTNDAITASRELDIRSHQIQYLAEYCKVVFDTMNKAMSDIEDIQPAIAESTRSWMIWSMELMHIDPDFRKVTGDFDTALGGMFHHLHALRKAMTIDDSAELEYEKERRYLTGLVGSYLGNIQDWQVVESNRGKVLANLQAALGVKK